MATTCAVLPGFLIGSQAVQLSRELALSAAEVGAAVSVAWLSASVTSSLMGRAAERLGGARALRVASLGSVAAMAWIALAARSWPLLAVGAAMGGVANALAQPSANLVIVRGLPPWRHGLGFGVKQAAVPMATVLGGLAVPLVTLTLGWRATFGLGAALACLAAVLLPRRTTSSAGAPLAEAGPDREPAGASRPRGGAVLTLLGTGIGFGAAAAAALSSFLVVGAVAVGVDEGPAGLLLMAGSAVGITARLVLGVRADRVGTDQLVLVAGLMATGSLALAAFALEAVPVYLAATPLAFGAGWSWPGLFNLSVVRRYPDRPGAATGTTQTGTYLGAALGPLVFGWLIDEVGFAWAWLGAACWLLTAAVAILAGRRLAPSPRIARGTQGVPDLPT